MINIIRVLKNSWRNFYRNMWLSVATLFMMFIALGVMGSLILFNASLDTFVAGLQDKVDVSVYFKDDASENQIVKLKSELEDRNEVKSINYISKEEALEIFTARHSDNEVLIESIDELDENPLQASINIKVFDPNQFAGIVIFLEGSSSASLIDSINFRENEKVINSISEISNNINRTGYMFSLILGVLVLFVTFNTIRLAIYTSREEIYIMKLVGGSNWFVRTPFVLTGAMYGFLSGILVLSAFFLSTKFLDSNLSLIFADLDLYSYLANNALNFSLIILSSGVLLGMISSYLAAMRYLRV